jgi:hypothetical protein
MQKKDEPADFSLVIYACNGDFIYRWDNVKRISHLSVDCSSDISSRIFERSKITHSYLPDYDFHLPLPTYLRVRIHSLASRRQGAPLMSVFYGLLALKVSGGYFVDPGLPALRPAVWHA